MNRATIIKEIKKNSPDAQKDALIKFAYLCETMNQWDAFTTCHLTSVGKYSYQAERIWTFNNEDIFELMRKSIHD